jgi:glucan 1,3-beta-glucosidase
VFSYLCLSDLAAHSSWSLGPDFCQGSDFEPVASVYTNSWVRVVRAINWAAKYDLGILIDMHGAYGSQNGQSHSGVSTGQAQFFWDPYNRAKTVDALVYLTQQLVDVNNVVGIELLNEPSNDPILADWCGYG